MQAAEDSLLRLYLTRQPPHLVNLPTSTFADTLGDVYQTYGSETPSYTPVEMSDTEVLYASGDKSGVKNPGSRTLADSVDID